MKVDINIKPKSVNRNQKTPSSKSSPKGRRPLFPLPKGEGQGEGTKFSVKKNLQNLLLNKLMAHIPKFINNNSL